VEDTPRTTRLGNDRLTYEGDRVFVDAPAGMEGWEVRRFRKTRIQLDHRAYEVIGEDPASHGGVRYVLAPWPDHLQDPPALEVVYDLEYVRARDAGLKVLARRRFRGDLLIPLYPVLGLLPASWKAYLSRTCDLHARTLTAWSIWLEYAGILVTVMLLALHTWTGIFEKWYLLTILAVLTPDALVRWNSLLEEEADPPGFYEWVRHFRLW
jgi:hypothetical protein